MYIYPKALSDFKDKDEYEIKHFTLDKWNITKTYSIGDCRSIKNYIEYLIVKNRVRIKK